MNQRFLKFFLLSVLIVSCSFELFSQSQNRDTLRLLLIGNSFSKNATTYLKIWQKKESIR